MELQNMIRRAIELGRPNGFITFDQLNELALSTTIAPEDTETIMQALSDEGINIED
jgi:hypothetical protein